MFTSPLKLDCCNVIQRCGSIEIGVKKFDLVSNECRAFQFEEDMGADLQCPDGYFLESINCESSPFRPIYLRCCKPTKEWLVVSSEITGPDWITLTGQKCPGMKVAVGLKWSVSEHKCRFTLICGTIEATAVAGQAVAYWKPVCSASCSDLYCPFGGEIGVLRERREFWDKQLSKSIEVSLKKTVKFGNVSISLKNDLVDGVMELVLNGHNLKRSYFNGFRTDHEFTNCTEKVWWQLRLDVEDVSPIDEEVMKFHILTPNIWFTNGYDVVPNCIPGSCKDYLYQTTSGPYEVSTKTSKVSSSSDSSNCPEIKLVGGKAEQSSTYKNLSSYQAPKAIDGDLKTHSDTAEDDKYPWWRLDLGTKNRVTRVGIRTDSEYAEYLHYFEIRVGDFDPVGKSNNSLITENTLCYYYNDHNLNNSQHYIFSCHEPNPIGRFMSIQVTKFCSKCSTNWRQTHNYVTFSEVDVFGHGCI